MAEGPRMTAAQVADKLLASEHADVLRQSVAWMVAELMRPRSPPRSAPSSASEPTSGWPSATATGPAAWDTRVGELELRIPRLRTGSYFPSFLEPRRRAEQALVAVVQEAYVNGVSTRKVDRLVEQLGIAGMSKDQVSRLCRGLDEQVRVFRERPLEGRYPYLWLDAKVERVREPGGVRHKALVIAYGVHQTAAARSSGWTWVRPRPRRSGASSCVACVPAGLPACACVSRTPTTACAKRSPRCSAAHGSAARCTSCATCSATSAKAQQPMIAAAIRGIFQAASLAEARQRLVEVVERSSRSRPRWPGCWRPPKPSCWRSMSCRGSTGPSCAPPTRWSASTVRSADVPTSCVSVGPAV